MQYEGSLNICLGLLCEKFTDIVNQRSECDLAHWLRLFSLDAICQITVGNLQVMELGKDQHGLIAKAAASTVYGNVV